MEEQATALFADADAVNLDLGLDSVASSVDIDPFDFVPDSDNDGLTPRQPVSFDDGRQASFEWQAYKPQRARVLTSSTLQLESHSHLDVWQLMSNGNQEVLVDTRMSTQSLGRLPAPLLKTVIPRILMLTREAYRPLDDASMVSKGGLSFITKSLTSKKIPLVPPATGLALCGVHPIHDFIGIVSLSLEVRQQPAFNQLLVCRASTFLELGRVSLPTKPAILRWHPTSLVLAVATATADKTIVDLYGLSGRQQTPSVVLTIHHEGNASELVWVRDVLFICDGNSPVLTPYRVIFNRCGSLLEETNVGEQLSWEETVVGFEALAVWRPLKTTKTDTPIRVRKAAVSTEGTFLATALVCLEEDAVQRMVTSVVHLACVSTCSPTGNLLVSATECPRSSLRDRVRQRGNEATCGACRLPFLRHRRGRDEPVMWNEVRSDSSGDISGNEALQCFDAGCLDGRFRYLELLHPSPVVSFAWLPSTGGQTSSRLAVHTLDSVITVWRESLRNQTLAFFPVIRLPLTFMVKSVTDSWMNFHITHWDTDIPEKVPSAVEDSKVLGTICSSDSSIAVLRECAGPLPNSTTLQQCPFTSPFDIPLVPTTHSSCSLSPVVMDAFSGHCHFLFATGSITAEQNGGLYCIAVKDLDDVPRRAPLAKVLLTPTHLPIESGVSHALFARRIALSMWTHELFSPGMPPEECRSVLGARISNEDVVLPPCEVVLRSRHNEILGFRIVPTFDYVDETFGVRYRVTFLGACRGPSFETWHQLEHVCWPSDLVTSGIVSKQVQIHKHVRKSFVKQLLCTRDGQRIVLESSGMATITTPRLSISLSHISRGKYTPGINALSQLALLPIREPRVIVGVTKEENIVFYQIDDWKVHYLPVVAEESLPLSLLQVLEAKAPEASFNVTILDLKTARLIEHQRVLVVVQLLLQSKTSSVQDTHLVGVKVGVSGRRVSLKVAFDFFYKMTAFGPGLVVSSSLEMLTHYKAHFDEGISSLVAMCDLDEPDPLDQVTTCSFALSHGVGSHTILATSPVLSFSELTRPHVGLYAVELDFRNEIAAFDLGKHSVLALGISSQTLLVLTTKLHILLVPLSGVGMQFTTLCATARIEIGRPFRRWAETRGESTVVDEPKRLKLLQKFKSKVRRGSTVEEQLPPGAFLQRLYNIYKAFKVGGVNVSHRHNSFLIQLHHGLGAPAERTVCDARCAVLITTNRMPKMHWTSLNVETTGRETHGWLSGIRAGLLISDDAFAAYTLSESAVLATVDGQITEFQRAVGKERHLMCTAENLLDLLHSRRMHLLRELLLRTGQVFAAFSREKSKAHQALEASLFPTKDYGILNLLLDPFLGLSFESKTKPSSIGTEADVPVAHRDPLSSSVTHPATPAGAATNVDMDFDSDAFDVDLFGSSSSSEDEEATALEKEFTALAKHGSEPPDGLISEDLIDYLLLCCDAFSEGLPDFLDASEMQRLKFFLSAFSKISQLRLQASCLLLEDWQVEAHYRGGLATSGHTLDDTPSTTADYALGDPSLQVEPVSLTALLSGYVNRDQESFLLSEALSIARAVGGGKLQWRILGSLGIAVWLESPAAVDTLLDDLTKDAFKHRRYPDDVAFWHCLRNKPVALSLLYRKDDRTRVAELFADTDLQSDKGRAVMVRNGFQLLSKKRHLYAAGCFLLAHAWSEAFDAIVRQVGDFHLGILVARVLDNRHVTPPEDSSFLHWLTRKWLSQESPAALWLLWSLSRDHLKAALTIVVPPEGPGDTEWRPLSVTGNLDLGTTSPLLYTALRKKNQLLLAQQLSGIGHVGVDVKDKAMYEEAIHDPTDFQRYHLGDVRISPLDLYEMSQLAGQGQDELTMRKLKASLIAPNLRSSGQDLLQMQILSCLDKPAAVETVSRYLFQLVSPPPEAVHLAILGYASYLASPLLHSEVQLPAAPSTLHCLIASHPDKLFQRLKTEIVSPVEQVVVDPLMPSHWISTGLVLAGSPYWRRLLGLLLLEQCMESYFRESFRACDFSTSLVCFRIRCFSLLRFYLEVLCNVCPELPMRLGSEPPPLSLFSHLFSPGLLSAFESLRGPVALQNICLLQPRLFLEDVKPISAEVHMSPCPIDLKSQVLYNFTPRTFRVLEAARFPEHLSKAVGFCQGILLVNTTSGLMEISTSRIKEDYVTGHGPVCDPNTLLVSLKLQQKSIVGSLPVTVSADTVQPATSITELHEEYCDLAAHLLARGLFPQPLGGVDSSLGIGLRLPYGPLSLWLKFELSEAMRLSNSLLSSLSTSLAKSQIHASHGMVLLHGQYPLLFLGLQTPVETETEWLTVAVYHYQKRKLEERSCLGYFGLPKSGHDSPDKVISMSLLQGGHRILVACASGLVALYQISYCGKGSHLPFITFRPHLFGLSAVVVDSGPALIIATGGRGMCSVGVERLAATMQAKGDPKPEIDRVSTALESDVPLTCLWQWRQSTHSVEPLLVDIGWSRHAEVRRIVRDSVTQKLFVCLSTGAPRVIDIPNRTCSNLIQNMDATTSWVDMCLLKDSLVLLSTTCRVVVINTITQAIVADVLASSLPETPTLGSLMQSAFSIHKTSHEALGVVPMADGVVVLLRHGVVKMRL